MGILSIVLLQVHAVAFPNIGNDARTEHQMSPPIARIQGVE